MQYNFFEPNSANWKNKYIILLGIMLIASVLRTPITGVGPLLDAISSNLNISPSQGGLLTSLPVFVFAAFALLAKYSKRVGVERSLFFALILIFGGMLIRSFGLVQTLFAGTLLLSIGIALGNVLLPIIIKRDFPNRATLLTTIYVTWMASTGAFASGVAVPLAVIGSAWFSSATTGGAEAPASGLASGLASGVTSGVTPGVASGLSWSFSLAVWAILAFIAIIVWLPQLSKKKQVAAKSTGSAQTKSVWKSPLAWQITVFMGLQAMGFYAIISWLPAIMQGQGYSQVYSGWLVAAYQLISLVPGLILPAIIARSRDQSLVASLFSAMCPMGALGLLLYPPWAMLWVCVAGFGGGISFILAISFISLRSKDHHQAAALSGMVQSVGYLIAAMGPLLFGIIHDFTHNWNVVLVGLVLTGSTQVVMAWKAGKNKTVS